MIIPVSIGEVVDKLTILSIKLDKIDAEKDPEKLKNITKEGELLTEVFNKELILMPAHVQERINEIRKHLFDVNRKLWEVEDSLRQLNWAICTLLPSVEASISYSSMSTVSVSVEGLEKMARFITLARSVYILNDKRSELKRNINEITNSEIKEEKFLPKY
jgi:hypothetical protein